MTKEALKQALEALTYKKWFRIGMGEPNDSKVEVAITAIKEALAQPEQEPVAMRMPKVGDKVVCIEDESLATVVSLTAGGSPDIVFSDGSRGTYLLREFAELFGYTTPPAAQRKPLTDEQIYEMCSDFHSWSEWDGGDFQKFWLDLCRSIEAAHGIKEQK
jgi:hypothetical protein